MSFYETGIKLVGTSPLGLELYAWEDGEISVSNGDAPGVRNEVYLDQEDWKWLVEAVPWAFIEAGRLKQQGA